MANWYLQLINQLMVTSAVQSDIMTKVQHYWINLQRSKITSTLKSLQFFIHSSFSIHFQRSYKKIDLKKYPRWQSSHTLFTFKRLFFILVQNFLLDVADAVSHQLSLNVCVVVEFDNLHACLDITYLMRVYYIFFLM